MIFVGQTLFYTLIKIKRAEVNAPKVLIISVKRNLSWREAGGEKDPTVVQPSEKFLKLKEEWFRSGMFPEEHEYVLVAAVKHQGRGEKQGHYITSVRTTRGRWRDIDDEHVSDLKTFAQTFPEPEEDRVSSPNHGHMQPLMRIRKLWTIMGLKKFMNKNTD